MINENPQFRGKELDKEQNFKVAIEQGIATALSIINKDFESTLIAENQLAYHASTHTRGVISRTESILTAIKKANSDSELVINRDIELGRFAAAWHDTVQSWQPNTLRDTEGRATVKRKRDIGNNERVSADFALEYMDSVNKQTRGMVFTLDDQRKVREAIILTIPNYDVSLGTVTQPEFANHKGNLIAQAVALADLGGGGMEGFKMARWETDSLFVEDNIDITEYLKCYKETGRRDLYKEAFYRERMLAWLKSQLRFSQGRQLQLQEEITNMDTRAQQPVRQLFTKYEETLRGIQTLIDNRQKMDFLNWMNSLGNP